MTAGARTKTYVEFPGAGVVVAIDRKSGASDERASYATVQTRDEDTDRAVALAVARLVIGYTHEQGDPATLVYGEESRAHREQVISSCAVTVACGSKWFVKRDDVVDGLLRTLCDAGGVRVHE